MNRDFLDMIRERFEYMRASVVHVLNICEPQWYTETSSRGFAEVNQTKLS